MTARRTAEWLSRSTRVTPGGSQTMSKQPARFGSDGYPGFATYGRGAVVCDVDGNCYVDWVGALGAMTLGHNHPSIVTAVARQLRDGSIFSLPHPLESEVAERLCAIVPCAGPSGMVRWTKTASEACAGAVRVARIATGRSVVLVAQPGYHGWHDWCTVTQPFREGIPREYGDSIRTFQYNDVPAFEQVLEEVGPDSIAAVILEPMRDAFPHSGYLDYLRHRTHDIGAALIFDETVLGFRLARAGGQEHFGVVPDLAVYGKALGGGLPLACLVGHRNLMKHAVIVSSTFGGDCLALAAAHAVLDVYEAEPVVDRLWRNGELFTSGIREEGAELPLECAGASARPYLRWHGAWARQFAAVFVTEMARHGVLVHADVVNPSAALTTSQLRATRAALGEALVILRDALSTPDMASGMIVP